MRRDFIANVSQLLGIAPHHLDVILPIGISFFTFTQIAFLVDAHKRKAAEPDPVNYSLFVTYFPHLIAPSSSLCLGGYCCRNRTRGPAPRCAPPPERGECRRWRRGTFLPRCGAGRRTGIRSAPDRPARHCHNHRWRSPSNHQRGPDPLPHPPADLALAAVGG